MVTNVKIIMKLILPLLVVAVFAGCAGIGRLSEPPYISLANINLLNMGVFEQRYRIMMRIQNPNDVIISIKGMSYRIFINEQSFARGVSNKPVIIAEPSASEPGVDPNNRSVKRQPATLASKTRIALGPKK